jgi:hypothetical protein
MLSITKSRNPLNNNARSAMKPTRHIRRMEILALLCHFRQRMGPGRQVRVAEIPCKPGAGLGKDRLKSAGAIQSQALLTESHGAGISG